MIDSFTGDFRFLSNFYPAEVEFEGVVYPTTENAFQAAKTADPEARRPFAAYSPGKAKRMGRAVALRPDWEAVKFAVMEQLLRAKFGREPFRGLLLATGDAELVEGNWWGDRTWGVCKGEGENHLGRLLMKVRADLVRDDEEQRRWAEAAAAAGESWAKDNPYGGET